VFLGQFGASPIHNLGLLVWAGIGIVQGVQPGPEGKIRESGGGREWVGWPRDGHVGAPASVGEGWEEIRPEFHLVDRGKLCGGVVVRACLRGGRREGGDRFV